MDYEFTLAQQDVQLILNALAELPLKVSLGTYGKVQQAVMAQDAARAIPVSELGISEQSASPQP